MDAPRSVNRVLARAAARHPGTVAVETDAAQLTYAELHDAALRLAGGLAARGVGAGDRVAACLPNGTEIVVAFYATQRLGAIWVGVNGQLAAPEKVHLLRETAPSAFLTTVEVLNSLASHLDSRAVGALAVDTTDDGEWAALKAGDSYDGPEIDPLGPAAIAFTSGTSGVPKGVVHSQHNLVLPGEVLTATRGYDGLFRRGDSLPLTILNLIVLSTLTAAQAGGTSVLANPMHADELAAWIGRKGLTVINAVPPILHGLVHSPAVDPRDLASLREVATGGAPCPEEIRARFLERFGLPVHATYGLTEAPSIVSIDDLDDPGPPHTSGRALPHLEVTIDPSTPGEAGGEVVVAAARSGRWAGVWRPALGYWGRGEEPLDVLRTGDVGELDDHGRHVIHERLSSVVLRGGANVYPAEVERVLRALSDVADAVVVGLPDERLGQTVHAVVELERGSARAGEELVEECRLQLARYKTPERIVVVGDIERNALGKPNRQWVVERIAKEVAT
jgi:acyl-CoA synthetase (AMP-forming)/AMP-acid ligase II